MNNQSKHKQVTSKLEDSLIRPIFVVELNENEAIKKLFRIIIINNYVL